MFNYFYSIINYTWTTTSMDAIKVEPESDGETYDAHINDGEDVAEEGRVPEPFAFAAVKVEVEVWAENLWA